MSDIHCHLRLNILLVLTALLLFCFSLRENVLAMLQVGQRVVDNPVYLSDLGRLPTGIRIKEPFGGHLFMFILVAEFAYLWFRSANRTDSPIIFHPLWKNFDVLFSDVQI